MIPGTAGYRLQAGDTPTTVAAALAALIPGATSAGSALTIPTNTLVSTVISADQTAVMEVRRQEQGYRVSCWCPSPASRDAVAGLVDLAFAGMMNGDTPTEFLALPDGEQVRIRYRATYPNDMPSKERLWRRDICLTVEYPTTVAQQQPLMNFAVDNIAPNGAAQPSRVVSIVAPPKATLGVIRWDAWYSTDALGAAVAADLSPSQFHYRAPFFSTVSTGVSFPAPTQSSMDAEIAAAKAGKIDYFAFNSWPAGSAESVALNLYLSSSIRSQVGFCIIVSASDVWFQGAGYSAEMLGDIALTAQPGYQTALDGRPLLYLIDTGDADILYRFGSPTAFQFIVADIRARVMATMGKSPYFTVLCSDPVRAAHLVATYGFDAASAYATPGAVTSPTPYASLVATTEAWWQTASALGADIIPPVMTGWNPSPRVVTPNALFGAESQGSATAYYSDGTASAIAAHARDAINWLAANRTAAPAQTALCYAWNEFDEGGWLCPTWLTGNAAGDTSRLTALAAALP
jgi:hypothetical protein